MQKYLMYCHGDREICDCQRTVVLIPPNTSSNIYRQAREAFARAIKSNEDSATMMNLRNHQCIQGIYYDYDFSSSGAAYFTLACPKTISQKTLESVKEHLQYTQGVLCFTVLNLEIVQWDPPQPLLPGQF